ncbi:MAG: hypothetical protein R6T96_09615, partial [Longimicrobiales bacterium]
MELAEWTGGNPFLEILDVFAGPFDGKILRQENRVLQRVTTRGFGFQNPLDEAKPARSSLTLQKVYVGRV